MMIKVNKAGASWRQLMEILIKCDIIIPPLNTQYVTLKEWHL